MSLRMSPAERKRAAEEQRALRAQRTYHIRWSAPCPACDGNGMIACPEWLAFHRENPDCNAPGWREKANALAVRAPREEVACVKCEGYGELGGEATLADALRELGVPIHRLVVPAGEEVAR